MFYPINSHTSRLANPLPRESMPITLAGKPNLYYCTAHTPLKFAFCEAAIYINGYSHRRINYALQVKFQAVFFSMECATIPPQLPGKTPL